MKVEKAGLNAVAPCGIRWLSLSLASSALCVGARVRLCFFFCLYVRSVVSYSATDRGAGKAMVAGNVSCDAANRGTFDTTSRIRNAGAQGE